MYTDELKEADVRIENIFLDPNNPRFWSERSGRAIAEAKITDPKVQATALNSISKYGVEELRFSILRNGFLPLDRIVVRAIKGSEHNFVVVEGNRRLAALLTLRQQISDDLIDEEDITDEYLARLVRDTNTLHVLQYEGTLSADISWLLQGIRHISGIRQWDAAQRAKLVAEQVDDKGMTFTSAGQQFGLTARAVGRYYRAYKALQQMRDDDEHGGKAKNEYFSLFEAAVSNKVVREWLGWDDGSYRFLNIDNARQFYSWIAPDDERDNKRRIHDPDHVKHLAYLLAGHHSALINRIDQYDIDIENALYDARNASQSVDWAGSISSAIATIRAIPSDVIREHPTEFLEQLKEAMQVLSSFARMAEAVEVPSPS